MRYIIVVNAGEGEKRQKYKGGAKTLAEAAAVAKGVAQYVHPEVVSVICTRTGRTRVVKPARKIWTHPATAAKRTTKPGRRPARERSAGE